MVRIQSSKKEKVDRETTGLSIMDDTFREYLLENIIRDLGKLQIMGWITNTAFDTLMQRLQLERSDPKGAATTVDIAPHAAGPTQYQASMLNPIMSLGGPQSLPAPSGLIGSGGGPPRLIGAAIPTAGRVVPPPPMITAGSIGEAQYVAIANFSTGEVEDLDLRAGDIITNVEEVDENWFRGRSGSRSGIFPKSYVQRSGIAPRPRRF